MQGVYVTYHKRTKDMVVTQRNSNTWEQWVAETTPDHTVLAGFEKDNFTFDRGLYTLTIARIVRTVDKRFIRKIIFKTQDCSAFENEENNNVHDCPQFKT